MTRSWLAPFALGLALMTALPAAAQTEVKDPPPTWSHRAAKVDFPQRLGAFERGRVFEYNEDGSDASVGYDLTRDGKLAAILTIYVYPANELGCDGTFTDAQAAITRTYKEAKLGAERRLPSPNGATPDAARQVRYTFPLALRSEQPAPVKSDLYLYCAPGDRWLVKYRATYLADLDLDTEIAAALRAIQWPAPLR
ncbi:hypothetical protein TPR58_17820 [Sphingomonas sp. HF-S3]|uniref:Lipoprotein n=1 Tax=Sphingomonas rustica TaxID=3103142 RepID=A0ABV0BF92_9SPHN